MLSLMSNLEKEPDELVCSTSASDGIEILAPRDVPLGGPRAMGVRRTLPQRGRSLIGGWCFIDHYGPEVTEMVVPPHPHTGLQTVSWLFSGEVEHRDSVGSEAPVLPGEVNLMTAGRGIQHSEVSPRMLLHGVQLWIALPDSARHTEPFFEHHTPVPYSIGDATVTVFVGGDSPVTTFSPLIGAQIDLPAFASIDLPVSRNFEHGILLDTGSVTVDGVPVPSAHLAYRAPGRSTITLSAGADATRLIFLGGEPLGEQIIMWWNFIGRSHDEIVGFRQQWMDEVIAGADPSGRFGHTRYDGPALAAPELPTVRLKPRE